MYYDMVLAFDMDDTLCNTNGEVYKRTLEYCLGNFMLEEAVYLAEHPRLHFSNYTGTIKQVASREVIEKRVYMDTARPTKLLEGLPHLLENVRRKFGNRVKIVICTHRGDNTDAWMSTYNYLKKHEVDGLFDMIHSIDHEVNKDKVGYLERMYPGAMIRLIDDNPFGSKDTPREFDSRVLMYNQIVAYKCYMNQASYIDDIDLFSRIASLLD